MTEAEYKRMKETERMLKHEAHMARQRKRRADPVKWAAHLKWQREYRAKNRSIAT